MNFYIKFLVICCLCVSANAWDSEELEIFDLVEEINKNFYEFMGIAQDASNQEVKRAFRNLSIILHPDKSSAAAEDANIQFRNLVSIYEVLKDPSKREKYNKVLKDGLPNWKSALYYYRRMRKIGLYEGSLIVFIIITIGQYLFAWAAYLEKKFTAEQVFGTRLKKLQKKNKNINMDSILNEIPIPSILNTLPFQIPLAIWNLPNTIKSAFNKANELKEIAMENRRLEAEELRLKEEIEKEQEEQIRLRKEKKENLRKRKQNTTAPEKTDADLEGYSKIQAREYNENDNIKPASHKQATLSGGFWTDEDLAELIRLVKKYPSGSSSRWDTIAESMNRSVQEVTFMAAKMKENGYRIPGQSDSVAENIIQDSLVIKKDKTKKAVDKDILIPETNWSQEQQRALENALVKYKKNTTEDRWQNIAKCVQGKTKQECLVRYKYLCEIVKSQKRAAAEAESNEAFNNADVSSNAKDVENDDIDSLPKGDDVAAFEEEPEEDQGSKEKGKKTRNKRKERRRRRDLSSDEDSDDAYHYEIS